MRLLVMSLILTTYLNLLNFTAKATAREFNESEQIRAQNEFDKFYSNWQNTFNSDFAKYISENNVLTLGFAYLTGKYALSTNPPLNIDAGDKTKFKEFMSSFTQKTFSDAYYDFEVGQYNTSQNKRIKEFFKLQRINYRLQNPEIQASIFQRVKFWENHQNNVIKTRSSELVGRLLYEGVTGVNTIEEYTPNFKPYRLIGDEQVVLSSRKRLNELLTDYTAAQKRVFVTTEANILMEMANRDHIDRNVKVYDSAMWNHKFGRTGSPAARSDEQLRPWHQVMHGKSRTQGGMFGDTDQNTFKRKNGTIQIVSGPMAPNMFPEDVVLCHCYLTGNMIQIPTRSNVWLGL